MRSVIGSIKVTYQKKKTEDVINRVYRYKLRLRPCQELALAEELQNQRCLYNRALAHKERVWKEESKSVSHGDLKKLFITEGRKINPYLVNSNYGLCAQTLTRLDRAYKAFFRRIKSAETPGFPRFKKYHEWSTLVYDSYGNGCRMNGDRLHLQGIGALRLKLYRPIPDGAVMRNIAVSRCPEGWFALITLEIPHEALPESEMPAVGIDVGVKNAVTTSDGEFMNKQSDIARLKPQVTYWSRKLARAQRGSRRRRYIRQALARVHRRAANTRQLWHRQVAKSLVSRYGIISHEDLQIINMTRKPKPKPGEDGEFLPNGAASKAGLNKAILDVAWGALFTAITSAAVYTGTKVVAVKPHNTTQRCSSCGCLPQTKVLLSQRTYRCSVCGLVLDRDWNAALNIRAEGLIVSASPSEQFVKLNSAKKKKMAVAV